MSRSPLQLLDPPLRHGRNARRGGAIALRTPREIDAMRAAGAVVRRALTAAVEACVAGATTAEADAAASQVIEAAGAEPLFLHYPLYRAEQGFPCRTCVSVDDEVVHGIPGARRLVNGDLVTIDCGVRLDGWCADAATTVAVGAATASGRRLLDATRAALDGAIAMIRPGLRWSTIAAEIEAVAEASGLSVVREYVGHGIGRSLHEPPEVPNQVDAGRLAADFTLRRGMTLAIEPIFAAGSPDTVEADDGWTVRTADGAPACHFEETIAVGADGAIVLTR
ncbi:MAG TPA: type I methionyl aminopeptidase [Phycisphaerales bacterium]|nr:type I methionyl aminopeptidase [Phycisphaerales bacterium]HMP36421.1 type I methionyl aminopeptidase [Phycisphaerales bacterium]